MDPWASITNEGADFGSIGEIISSLLTPIFTLAGMIALLFLIWGGIRYMTARGDPKIVDSARGTITSAVIGLLIVLFSALIFYFIGGALKFDIFAGIFSPPTVHAQVDIGKFVDLGGGNTINIFSNIVQLFTNILYVFLAAAALVFLAMLVWGGLRYINAGGDPKNAESARSTLTNAGIGLLIVVLSLVIIEIITRLVGLESIFG